MCQYHALSNRRWVVHLTPTQVLGMRLRGTKQVRDLEVMQPLVPESRYSRLVILKVVEQGMARETLASRWLASQVEVIDRVSVQAEVEALVAMTDATEHETAVEMEATMEMVTAIGKKLG